MCKQRIIPQRSPCLLDQQRDGDSSKLDATVNHRALQQLFAHQCALVSQTDTDCLDGIPSTPDDVGVLYSQRWTCQSVQVYVERRLDTERTEWHRQGVGGVRCMTLLWLPVPENHTKRFIFNDGEALECIGFLASDTTSGEFKHSEKGTRERRLWVANNRYKCLNASVKRAPHLCCTCLSRFVTRECNYSSFSHKKLNHDPDMSKCLVWSVKIKCVRWMKLRRKCRHARNDSTNASPMPRLTKHI